MFRKHPLVDVTLADCIHSNEMQANNDSPCRHIVYAA